MSDFTNTAQGTDVGDLSVSTGLLLDHRSILVNSGDSIYAPRNLLFSIDPASGDRSVLSDFDNPAQGTQGTSLHGLVKQQSGALIVAAGDASVGASDATILIKVDRRLAAIDLVLSNSSNTAQGPAFIAVVYLALVP